jgi:2-iminobutanoate/2-iminopropanoate deaminase
MLTFVSCSTGSHAMKSVIYTPNAPAPIGPYSQATEAGGFIFISGQIAINPANSEMYTGDDISAETRQVMENLKAIVTQSGCTMKDIMKCTIFLRDMNDFAAVNAVYGEYFPEYPPARETVAVVGLPKNARVEISAVVVR